MNGRRSLSCFLTLSILVLWTCSIVSGEGAVNVSSEFPSSWISSTGSSDESGHSNNWAVLVCTSTWWYNYRHISNVLAMYRALKQQGFPDSHIIVMLADDVACNSRNCAPGQVFTDADQKLNLYGDDVEVDYRGYEVTVEAFLRVLTGRHTPGTPDSWKLGSDDASNVLIYMTGHGGDGFLKFQDVEEISSVELADGVEQAAKAGRYKELLIIVDTCQAGTLFEELYSRDVIAVGSSARGQNSYSYQTDPVTGVSVVDRFTYYTLRYLERMAEHPDATLDDLAREYNYKRLGANEVWRSLMSRPRGSILLREFFASEGNVDLTLPSSVDWNWKVSDSNSVLAQKIGDQVKVVGGEEGGDGGDADGRKGGRWLNGVAGGGSDVLAVLGAIGVIGLLGYAMN